VIDQSDNVTSSEDAVIFIEGERLIVEVDPPRFLLSLLATLSPLEEDFHRGTGGLALAAKPKKETPIG